MITLKFLVVAKKSRIFFWFPMFGWRAGVQELGGSTARQQLGNGDIPYHRHHAQYINGGCPGSKSSFCGSSYSGSSVFSPWVQQVVQNLWVQQNAWVLGNPLCDRCLGIGCKLVIRQRETNCNCGGEERVSGCMILLTGCWVKPQHRRIKPLSISRVQLHHLHRNCSMSGISEGNLGIAGGNWWSERSSLGYHIPCLNTWRLK